MPDADPGLLAFLPLAFAVVVAVGWVWWVRRVSPREDSRARWRYRQDDD